MKLRTFSLVTHVGSAAIAALATGVAVTLGGSAGFAAGAVVGILIGVGAGLLLDERISQGFTGLKRSLAARRWESQAASGIAEFDEMTVILSDHDRRLTSASGRAQEQIQDVQKLLGQLDRRSETRRTGEVDIAAGRRLREILTGLARATNEDLKRVLALSAEIEQNTKVMSAGASDQTDAVSKTTTYVEQMSSNIDLVTMNAESANQSANAVRDCSVEAQKIVKELISGMERIRRHVEAGWRKLRALGDRTQEIGSIVETIAGIAARTDMLALNASIESVRAGEHGRGFAVVADEVRKLAEQAAQATKEVAGLIETVQLETQESIGVMAQEHAQVEAEVGRVNSAGDALEKISSTSADSANRVGEISRVTKQQLRFTQEVVLAMERISEVARGIRGRAEGVSWTTNTLSGLIGQLETTLSPLKGCVGELAAHEGDETDDEPSAEGLLRETNQLLQTTQSERRSAERDAVAVEN